MTVIDRELTLARKIAFKIGSRWSAVEIDDLASELTLWLFENSAAVERYRDEPGGEGKLFVALRRKAAKYCAREQAIRSGAPLDAEARYTVTQIERGLPFVWEDAPQTVVAEDPLNGRPLGESYNASSSTNAVSVLLDFRLAFDALPDDLKTILTLRFRDGMTYREIGALTELTDNGARKRVRRGVRHMQQLLDDGFSE